MAHVESYTRTNGVHTARIICEDDGSVCVERFSQHSDFPYDVQNFATLESARAWLVGLGGYQYYNTYSFCR